MTKKKKQTFSAPAGEHLVLGELLRKGFESYLAHGKTQKGWDIVLLKEHGKNVRIQVKSIDWPNEIAVNGRFGKEFDFLIVVLHNKKGLPRYLIIPQSDLESIISKSNPERKGKQRTLTVGKNFERPHKKNLVNYENKWDLFKAKTT